MFGEKVRQLRKDRGLSQETLAAMASFDRTYISLVERGLRNLSLLNICRLAKALEVELSELVEGL